MYFSTKIDFTPEEVLDYLRKSRSDDPLMSVEDVLSKHEAMLDEWAEKHLGGKVPEENKFREVVSGETLKERPEIQKVLKLIESPRYKAIKVVEPQRLTRGDYEDIGRLMKLLKHTNTLVITPQKIYDLKNEYDWDGFERELKRGNDYLEYTKKILNRGRLLSVSQGNYIGSKAPFGYDKIEIKDGRKTYHTLKENKEQADIVRMIFNMYVNENIGRMNICHRLDNLGIKSPTGQRWSSPALKDMLENVHYIGKVKWNWRKTITVVEDGQIFSSRPKSKEGDYLIFEGKHDGIVPEELFMAAREKRGRNHKAKATTKVRNPFAGLVICQCGRAMSYRMYKHKDGSMRSPSRLLCDDQVHCQTASAIYDEIEEAIVNVLKGAIANFEMQLDNTDDDFARTHERIIKNLEKKKKELEEKELAQWEAQAHPDPSQRMPQPIFQKLNAKLQQEKEEIRIALNNAYESMPEPVDYQAKIVQFQEAIDALYNPNISAEHKNKLLKAIIERIDYNRKKPVRLTKKTCVDYGIEERNFKDGSNWYSFPMELDIKLKV